MTLKELFTGIADTIRMRNPYAESKIKATDFPSAIDTACSESEILGYNGGLAEGYAQGRQEQYDEFWDEFQQNGNRTDYRYAFSNWNTEALVRPKHKVKPEAPYGASYLFFRNTNVEKVEADYFDLSMCNGTDLAYAFVGANSLVEIEDIGIYLPSALSATFQSFRLKKIAKITVDETCKYNSTFNSATALEEVYFEGIIGNTISFKDSSKLIVESLRSILTALSKDPTQASGKAVTFNTASKAVIEADTICSEQLALAVSAGWTVAYNS